MARAILLGSVPLNRQAKEEFKSQIQVSSKDLKIGIDGGAQLWLDLGWTPDLYVGDEDSLPARLRRRLHEWNSVRLSPDKDRSDLHYASLQALKWGAQELIYHAVTGGPRLDHHLATLLDLTQMAKGRWGRVQRIEAHGVEGSYYFLSPEMPLWRKSLSPGQLVSIFAMTQLVRGVHLQGFKFPLRGESLKPHSRGLSNRVSAERCEIRIKSGVLLVVIPSCS